MARPSRSRGNRRPANYSIQLVARSTGITADALRMWERRYGYPDPVRDDRGNRQYTGDDIRRLQQIRRAMQAGFKAAEVVGKPQAELDQLLAGVADAQLPVQQDSAAGPWLEPLLAGDAAKLRQELGRIALSLGPREFVAAFASPMVEEVGRLWEAGKLDIHQEHLASALLGTQLRMLLSGFGEAGDPVVALATLSGERHALGMWMAGVYLASQGAGVRVLGPDLPAEQIVRAARTLEPRVVGVSVSASADLHAVKGDLLWMLEQLPADVEVWAGGKASAHLGVQDRRLRAVVSWQDLDRALARLR